MTFLVLKTQLSFSLYMVKINRDQTLCLIPITFMVWKRTAH